MSITGPNTGQHTPGSNPRSRLFGWLLVIVLTAVIVGFVLLGLANATSRSFAAPGGGAAAGSTSSASATAATTASASVTSKVPAVTATAQATKSASITKSQTIVKAFAAKVVKMTAVQGQASGPGEIAGPAVRFTIELTNTTGEPIDLSTTVVNAYYGTDKTPADSLDGPGGAAFGTTLANGATATGTYVFSIPEDERGTVEVTIDTSVANSVAAFIGAAPR